MSQSPDNRVEPAHAVGGIPMEQRPLRRSIDLLLLLYSIIPLGLLIAFYSFVVRARIELGRWPIPMSPDPKDLSFAREHGELVFWLSILTVCCVLPWLLLVHFRIKMFRDTRLLPLLLFVPWLLVAGSWIIDPGSFVYWFLD